MSLSSGSMLQPLRTGIFDLLKLRRRLEIHADSQVWSLQSNCLLNVGVTALSTCCQCQLEQTVLLQSISISIVLRQLACRLSLRLGCLLLTTN